jgi:hypothetical protein
MVIGALGTSSEPPTLVEVPRLFAGTVMIFGSEFPIWLARGLSLAVSGAVFAFVDSPDRPADPRDRRSG